MLEETSPEPQSWHASHLAQSESAAKLRILEGTPPEPRSWHAAHLAQSESAPKFRMLEGSSPEAQSRHASRFAQSESAGKLRVESASLEKLLVGSGSLPAAPQLPGPRSEVKRPTEWVRAAGIQLPAAWMRPAHGVWRHATSAYLVLDRL